MKTVKLMLTAVLIVGLAGFAYAGKITKNSSWSDILADDSLRVVFPTIEVEGGKLITYDQLFLDADYLTTGSTYEAPTSFEYVNSDKLKDKDRESPRVLKTVTKYERAPLNYTNEKCTEINDLKESKDTYAGPFMCFPVEGEHPTTVNVSVYKKQPLSSIDTHDRGDTFLFVKKYTVPVYQMDEMVQ